MSTPRSRHRRLASRPDRPVRRRCRRAPLPVRSPIPPRPTRTAGTCGIWGVTGVNATTALTLPPACLVTDPAALQAAFDQGHQPWRGDPVANAEVCLRAAYGWPHPHGRLLSADHVLAVDDTIGEDAEVHGR